MTDDQDERQAVATEIEAMLRYSANHARMSTKEARDALSMLARDVDTYPMGVVNIVAAAAAQLAQQTEVLLDAERRAHRAFTLELMTEDEPPEDEEAMFG